MLESYHMLSASLQITKPNSKTKNKSNISKFRSMELFHMCMMPISLNWKEWTYPACINVCLFLMELENSIQAINRYRKIYGNWWLKVFLLLSATHAGNLTSNAWKLRLGQPVQECGVAVQWRSCSCPLPWSWHPAYRKQSQHKTQQQYNKSNNLNDTNHKYSFIHIKFVNLYLV